MLSLRHVSTSLALLLFSAGFASAQVTTSNPGLPPDTGVYLTPAQVHADYSGQGLTIVLSQVQHQPFARGDSTLGIPGPVITDNGPNETESFGSELTGMASVNGSPNTPFVLTGPVSVEAFGKAGNVTGTFNTQMLSMDLTGSLLGNSIEVVLDPNNPTTGQTSITDIGGGLYDISSFFDVFTDLSVNGGAYIPQSNGPTLVQLEVPEPTSMAVLGAGALFLLRRRRSAKV